MIACDWAFPFYYFAGDQRANCPVLPKSWWGVTAEIPQQSSSDSHGFRFNYFYKDCEQMEHCSDWFDDVLQGVSCQHSGTPGLVGQMWKQGECLYVIITEVNFLCLLLCNCVFSCSFISCILVLALYSFVLDLLTFGDFCRNFKPIYFSFRFKHVSRLVWTPRCLAVSLQLCFTHQKSLVVLVCCPWDTCSFLSQISGYFKFLFVVVVFLFLQFESRLSRFSERSLF